MNSVAKIEKYFFLFFLFFLPDQKETKNKGHKNPPAQRDR